MSEEANALNVLNSLLGESLKVAPPSDHFASLRDHGLDSLGIVDLLGGLEDALQLSFNDDDLNMENFESIDSILSLIRSTTNLDRSASAE